MAEGRRVGRARFSSAAGQGGLGNRAGNSQIGSEKAQGAGGRLVGRCRVVVRPAVPRECVRTAGVGMNLDVRFVLQGRDNRPPRFLDNEFVFFAQVHKAAVAAAGTLFILWRCCRTGQGGQTAARSLDSARSESRTGTSRGGAYTLLDDPVRGGRGADGQRDAHAGLRLGPSAARVKFLEMWVTKNTELVDKYQADMLWFDLNGGDRGWEPLKLRVAAYYHNWRRPGKSRLRSAPRESPFSAAWSLISSGKGARPRNRPIIRGSRTTRSRTSSAT